ncbi:tripartite tricarboxylate transporter substrate-binding protein, partial [Halomonas sp. BBD48]|nr:tripartite tricarboxylate transporter substrate-binding protein [Halomonas sp. BBD48]
FPDVPTVKEAIGSDYTIGEWRGIAGPKGMDQEIVDKLEQALEAAYNSETYQGFMSKQGFGTEWRNAEDFETMMGEMDQEYGNIIESIGLKK